MCNLPKISIITPSYNQGSFIEQTIVSVLEQGYPNLEYFVIDGGSTDDTIDIIKKYQKYITFWVSEKDGGQSEAINKGFNKVTGEVVNWLNSDDFYQPGVLQEVGDTFRNKDINVLCGRSKVFGAGVSYLTNGTDIYPDNIYKTIGQARIDQPETFFRYSSLKQIGFVNENLHFIMDKELWIRYLLKFGLKNVVKSTNAFVNYRLHESSKTVKLQKMFAEETRSFYYTLANRFGLSRFSDFLINTFEVKELPLIGYERLIDKQTAYRVVNYYFLEQALVYYAQDKYEVAKKYLFYIDPKELSASDQEELSRIVNRMRIPIAIKQVYHFMNNIIKKK